MNKLLRTIIAMALACTMLCGVALADSISLNGTVTAAETCEVYAPIGGGVANVAVEPGQLVAAGDVIAELRTNKYYAEHDGVISGIFAAEGDSADAISARYGAVMYIEGASYTISATIDEAYNDAATRFVHTGEAVYLKCRTDAAHTGTGIITAINGNSYTVEVTSGEFLPDEIVGIFRSESYSNSERIGRGNAVRKNPTAVTGNGGIVSIAVEDGATVTRGQLLFETLDGSFDGLVSTGTQITANAAGVVSSVNAQQGGSVQKNSVVAVIWPADSMRVEADIDEDDLGYIKVGDKVSIELNWNQDDEVTYPGTVTMIAASSNGAGGAQAKYKVWIDFTPDENTRFGMNAVITTVDDESEPEGDDEGSDEGSDEDDEDTEDEGDDEGEADTETEADGEADTETDAEGQTEAK